jgi:hypothetical protein
MRSRLTEKWVIVSAASLVGLAIGAALISRTNLDTDRLGIVGDVIDRAGSLTGDDDGDAARAVSADPGAVARPSGPAPACNGFAELCDKALDEVAFAATHNSMSAAEDPEWIAPNQHSGITRQLDDGIRALLIDTHYGSPVGPAVLTDLETDAVTREELEDVLGPDLLSLAERLRDELLEAAPGEGRPYLCHVLCELGAIELTTALGELRDFLVTHPDEAVILFIEDGVEPDDAATAFERTGLLRYTYAHESGAPFPTMRELIESNQRVVVLAEAQAGGPELPWYHPGFELVQETPFEFKSAEELAAAASCKPNRGDPESPILQLNNWIEQPKPSPENARDVNQFKTLIDRIRRCERRRGLDVNILAVDFYDEGDVLGVANRLNGLDRNARASVREIG